MESKKVEIEEAKGGFGDRQGWGKVKWGKGVMLVKVYKLPVIRGLSFRGWMYFMVTIINNTTLYTWNLQRLDFKYS